MCVRVRACMSVFATGSVWPSDEKSTLSRFEVRTCEARWRKRGWLGKMSEKNVEETNSLLDEMHIYLWSNMNESPTTMYSKVVGRNIGASDLARSR